MSWGKGYVSSKTAFAHARVSAHVAILLAFGFLSVSPAEAVLPPELKRYFNCHERLTSTRPPIGDARVTQIKAGTLTGTAACMQLWDSAALGSNNQVGTADARSMKLLRKLNEIHRGFVGTVDFFKSFDESHHAHIIDPYEVGNAWTYYALKPNQTFSNILTAAQSYRAIRKNTSPGTEVITNKFVGLNFRQTDGTAYTPSVRVQEGILLGVQPDTAVNTYTFSGREVTNNGINHTYVTSNMNANLGAGIVGAQAYALANDAKYGVWSDGVFTTRRRWSKYVYQDILCRDLPAVRQVDAAAEVIPGSAIPFRAGASCVTCHTSMDKLASVARNHNGVRTTSVLQGFGFIANRVPDMADLSTNAITNIFPTAADSNFYRRPSKGALFYRSYDGSLANYALNNLADLSARLTQSNDFYVCAASKYYKAMTGISVNLGDNADPAAPLNLSSGELFHRNKVIDLGVALKSHQSLRTLVEQIISSPAFISPNLGQ